MPRIICELPNASLEISGVKFERQEDTRLISEEIDDELTALFASIPGYLVADEDELPEKVPELTPAQKKKLEKDQKAAKAQQEADAQKLIDDQKALDAAAAQKVIDDQKALDDAAAQKLIDDQKALDDAAAIAEAERLAAEAGNDEKNPADKVDPQKDAGVF